MPRTTCDPDEGRRREALDSAQLLLEALQNDSPDADVELIAERAKQSATLLMAFESSPLLIGLCSSLLVTCNATISHIATSEGMADAHGEQEAEGDGDSGEKQFSVVRGGALQLTWRDVIGNTAAVEALQQAVVLPARFPHLFVGARRPWKCILLYGPPGTGKTLLATVAASEAQSNFITVSAADLLSKWVGESEKALRQLFAAATRGNGVKTVLFLDEIDSLCGARGETSESEAARRLKTEFLLQMQRVDATRVLIIAATNLPWCLDTAFRRRFDQLIYVGLPDLEARIALVQRHLADTPNSLSDADLHAIAEQLHRFSGSDIAHVVQHAAMNPVRLLQQASHFVRNAAGKLEPCSVDTIGAEQRLLHELHPLEIETPAVSQSDFQAALATYPRSVSDEYLDQYSQWTRSLGLTTAPSPQ